MIKIPPIEGVGLLKDIKIPPTYIAYIYMLYTCVYWLELSQRYRGSELFQRYQDTSNFDSRAICIASREFR